MRCTRHAITFARAATCEKCATDPPPAPDVVEAAAKLTAPRGCMTSVQLEVQMGIDLKQLRKLRNGLARTQGKTPREYNAIAKLQAESTRLQRALIEVALRREDAAIVEARERRWLARGARRQGASH